MIETSTSTVTNSAKVHSRSEVVLLLAGILLVAVNLRPALAGVGPLIGAIRQSIGFSNSLLGLLTTIPLLAFGVVSTSTPLFTRRFGIGGTLLGAMALLAIGAGLRSVPTVAALYLGTVFVGVAIAFGNVLLPSLVKRNFSSNSGFIYPKRRPILPKEHFNDKLRLIRSLRQDGHRDGGRQWYWQSKQPDVGQVRSKCCGV